MARGPRLRYRGAVYHVMSRGNRKAAIFDDAEDRLRFLDVFSAAAERYTLRCHSYCLMGNHYHLVLDTPRGNLSDAMKFLNGVYAQSSNWRHNRSGHLLEGRFVSLLVDNDHYLRNANVYVVLNPVSAGIAASARDWPWSSYGATAGLVPPPAFLDLDWIDRVFGGPTREESQRRYREFINALPTASTSPIEEALVDGSTEFTAAVRSKIGAELHQVRLPRDYRALARPPLEEIFDAQLPKAERNSRIVRAHVVHGYRLVEVADYLCLHPNTLSKIMQAVKTRGGKR